MFSKCPSVTEEHLKTSEALGKKYRPIENDPTVPIKEKSDLMEEWWLLSEKALM